MASNYKLRRFSNPSTLKAMALPLLVQFFWPYREFLASHGFDLSVRHNFDYDELAVILMTADEDTPDAMLDAMFFVDEMSIPTYFEDLRAEAHAAGINVGDDDNISAADLAVRIWLADHDILERLHAERFLVRPKSFQSFLSTSSCLPDMMHPSDSMLQTLESDLNAWFETKKRGRGTRVFPFVREDAVWFLVRHGEPYKREGTIHGDESSSIYYRPERFDVLTYKPSVGELAIHAMTKGEKKAYCQLFGKHLFGSETFFDTDRLNGKFTLRPIIDDGSACVACSDIDGLEEIRLTELQFRHESNQYHVEIHKAEDVFSALQNIGRSIPSDARLLRAGFKVKFDNALRPRMVVIRQPNVTIFDRESDADLLTEWMTRRGFILLEPNAHGAEADAVLAIS